MNTTRLRARSTTFVVIAIGSACLAAPLHAGPLPRLAISLRQAAEAAVVQQGCRSVADALVVVPAGTFAIGGDAAPLAADAARKVLAALARGTDAFLQLEIAMGGGAQPDEAALESRLTTSVSALPLTAVKGLVLRVAAPVTDTRLMQFTLATLVVKARAVNPILTVTLAFPHGVSTTLAELARRAATYADAVAVTYQPGWREDAAFIERSLHKSLTLRIDASVPAGERRAARDYLDALVDAGDLSIDTVWADLAATDGVGGLCTAVAAVTAAVPATSAAAQQANIPVAVALTGEESPALRAFLDSRTANVALLVRTSASTEQPRTLTIAGLSDKAFEITCAEAVDGRSLSVATAAAKSGAASVRTCTCVGSHVLVTVHWVDTEGRAFENVNVTGRAELRVEEIIARWQQAREAERQLFTSALSACLLSLHFEPTGLGGGFDVALELRHFLDRSGQRDWVQTGFFLNGVRLKGRREFPLPQLEPEKVLSQPLDLRLDEKYSYSLAGTETVDGALCYVIRIEPKEAAEALYRGRMWIDGLRFRQVRAELEQRGGRSNIISHTETQDFQLVADGQGHQFNVLRRIYVQEILNAAGRSFLLEKTFQFSDYVLNGGGFDSALAAARASQDPMFRDTAVGLRSLRKEGSGRVVESIDTKRMRSLVLGSFYDGTFGFPIPLGGLSFVDFDWRQTGNQLSVFFAGPIFAADLSRQLGKGLRIGFDLALSGVPQNSRVYVGDTEATAERVWKFDETVGGLVSWQPTANLSLTGSSYVTVNLFRTTSDTDPLFLVPKGGYTLDNAAEAKFVTRGYGFTGSVIRGDRVGWGSVGYATAPSIAQASYLKYSAEIGKQGYIGRFTKLGLSLAYFGGDRLDRFSRYQPSFLSKPRVRGIPSGTDAFDDIAIAGASYGFNVMELVKLEGAYNHAWARNRQESHRFKGFDGLQFDVGTAAPWNMFLQGTVSYALRGNTARYNSRWSVYLLLFKPLRR
jgi:hypothetical protein